MSFDASFVLVTWMAIALLTLGIIGCIRNLRLLSETIETRLQSPARLKAGDRVRVPAHLQAAVGATSFTALLFLQAECPSCLTALETLKKAVERYPQTELAVLWKGDPHPGFADVGVPHAVDAFRAMNVGLTPFFVVLRDDTVILSSRVGSRDDLDGVQDVLAQYNSDTMTPELS